ncbi:putative bifunctional diguanylate cyclase/phosphodiesterase [Marinomonas algicola]|uniref:putative bifunctional diguanylate cyclase/phosphodiesterase n=1 Tax=Marinomonas algicola TaxID=2773454 RepID=UPI001749CB4C|nr:bifunctional diguanylate cyclase/phosphodiesterase [Marinomonas algicola]
MQSITALKKDPYFKLRLILVCLGVAIAVSIIYITVVYKIAVDIGETTEFDSIRTEGTHLEYVLNTHALGEAKFRIRTILNKNYLPTPSKETTTYGFILFNSSIIFSTSNLPEDIFHQATDIMKKAMEKNDHGIFDINNDRYAWVRLTTKHGHDILFIKQARSLSLALDYITQRLIITSFITFWIAVWLALFLATWMNKKVQSKNDALTHIATHDTLTGLPNRLYLFSKCNTEIQELISKQSLYSDQKSGAILLIDLNDFKEINDAYGHDIGDMVLNGFCQRIQNTLTKEETLVRMGGDEFIIWGKNLTESSALEVSEQLRLACINALVINDISIEINPSIGISLLFQHGLDLDSLITNADLAMYQSKSNHLGPVVYNNTLGESYLYDAKLRGDVSEAILKEQIFLLYQPKIELNTGRLIGVEVLARWDHPIEGIVSPVHFIPLIEKSVHIHKFTRYILEKSIKQVSQWRENGIDTTIAVNISPYNLLDDHFGKDLEQLLQSYNVPVTSIEIELTETAMMNDISSTKRSLLKLRKLGIRIAIDDFGTGLSSLSYISQLDASVIKIDRSFIMDINTNPHNLAIVEAVISLSHRLNWEVVAEGIETQGQLKTLADLGCQHGQGYYFDRPLSVNDLTSLLQAKKNYSI